MNFHLIAAFSGAQRLCYIEFLKSNDKKVFIVLVCALPFYIRVVKYAFLNFYIERPLQFLLFFSSFILFLAEYYF